MASELLEPNIIGLGLAHLIGEPKLSRDEFELTLSEPNSSFYQAEFELSPSWTQTVREHLTSFIQHMVKHFHLRSVFLKLLKQAYQLLVCRSSAPFAFKNLVAQPVKPNMLLKLFAIGDWISMTYNQVQPKCNIESVAVCK